MFSQSFRGFLDQVIDDLAQRFVLFGALFDRVLINPELVVRAGSPGENFAATDDLVEATDRFGIVTDQFYQFIHQFGHRHQLPLGQVQQALVDKKTSRYSSSIPMVKPGSGRLISDPRVRSLRGSKYSYRADSLPLKNRYSSSCSSIGFRQSASVAAHWRLAVASRSRSCLISIDACGKPRFSP